MVCDTSSGERPPDGSSSSSGRSADTRARAIAPHNFPLTWCTCNVKVFALFSRWGECVLKKENASPLKRDVARSSQEQPSRKPTLLILALVILLSMVLSSWAAAQSSEPIKIGILLPKSGTYTVQGGNGHNGAMLAVEDFGGKVLGRPVELIWEDESTPQASV